MVFYKEYREHYGRFPWFFFSVFLLIKKIHKYQKHLYVLDSASISWKQIKEVLINVSASPYTCCPLYLDFVLATLRRRILPFYLQSVLFLGVLEKQLLRQLCNESTSENHFCRVLPKFCQQLLVIRYQHQTNYFFLKEIVQFKDMNAIKGASKTTKPLLSGGPSNIPRQSFSLQV